MTSAARSNQILDENNIPVQGALVYVYDLLGNLAPLTSDGTTSILNPLKTDQFGNYAYQALVGYYNEDIWYGGRRQWRENNVALGNPGADLALRTDLAATSGSSLTGFIQSGTGAVGRSAQDKLRESVTAADFGAVADGVTDDSAAILSAITAAGAGGSVTLAAGKTYAIASTLLLSTTGSRLVCVAGDGDTHDTGAAFTAPATLKWIGASGGTMVKVKSASTQFISGNEFRGIFLDGNAGLAAVGLNVVGCRLGTFDVVGQHLTTAILKMDPDTALSEPQGCSENRIIRVSGYQTNVGDGCHVLETSTASYNCSHNTYELISGDFRNGYAVDVQGSDSESFNIIKLYGTQTSCVGIRFKAGATTLQTARNNKVGVFALAGATPPTTPALAEGTGDGTVASYGNRIERYDDDTNPNLPVVHTGASLSWSSIKAGIGLRSYTAAAGSLVQQDASGKIIQSGISNSLAAGASQVITLPKAFGTGAMAVAVTPKTAATTFFAGCSSTQLTITNGTGATTDFFWRVEGF